ncbi:MAG: phenylalanine--tRNA ligase subunit beta [Ignavibacteriales bacterium]|nr:phenylalanine--tRNA ligase subunit beta [Ignavibacteriales bacterium]
MKISHDWLKECLSLSLRPAAVADKLSMVGLEVAGFEELAARFDKFVVGGVVERSKHPNADRLSLCKVDVGSEMVEVVCGAPNVAAGQKVVVGLVGAVIPRNQHDPDGKPFTLERVHIRGVQSTGMICSEYELGLGGDSTGILVLKESAKPGTPFAKFLGLTDVIYDMEVTANRGDWLSHIGVARELQMLTGKKAALKKVTVRESKTPTTKLATVKIQDSVSCRRYSARVVRNVTMGPSPKWMQDRLESIGIRPINNIVDITNYVLMETGQPLHAFDYDRLAGHAIVVKRASEGDTFTTLDGKERVLKSDTLMICDREKPVAIAGVMGGANTEISDETTTVLIESANFDPGSVRRTSKYLGLSTDASQRFERGVDIGMTVFAANRAAQLMQELTGAEILKGGIDCYPKKLRPTFVALRVDRANAILGTSLSKAQIVSYLKRLDLKPVGKTKDTIKFQVPSFRYDIEEEIDLIEEIARAFGYDNIETKTRTTVDFGKPLRTKFLQDEIRSYLIGAGFNEMLTYSLQDRTKGHLMGDRAVEVLNPVSAEASVLRTSLVPGALTVVQHNRSHGRKDLRMFEIGNVFGLRGEKAGENLDAFLEEERILVVLCGHSGPAQYGTEHRSTDLFDLKGEVQALLSKFCLDKYRFISYDSASALIESALAVEINSTYAGFLGKVGKSIVQGFDIDDSVFVCELSVTELQKGWVTEKKLEPLPRFPGVHRDLAFVVSTATQHGTVAWSIREAGGTLLTDLVLFDMYVGDQVGAGSKSLAYSLEFQPMDRTLTDSEIDAVVTRIVQHVELTCNAKLRAI